MNTEDWSLLVSALSLIASIVATATSFVSYRASKQNMQTTAEVEAEKRWTMSTFLLPAGERIVNIDYIQDGPLIRFLEICVIDPEGLRIQQYTKKYDDVPDNPKRKIAVVMPSKDGPQKALTVNRDMNERTIGGGTISLMLLMPSKPYWARSATSIIRLAVKYEKLDAGRCRRDIIVKGPEIVWTG